MSNAMQNLCRPLQLIPSEKAVLMCLADCASDNGHCFMLVSTLELYTCLGERTVRRAIASLVERGYVRQELRTGRSSVFWLIPEAVDAGILPEHRRSLTPASTAPPPARLAVTPANVAPTPANVAPITMSEPCLIPHHPKSGVIDGFETVWRAYPRKTCKVEAEKAWRRLPMADALVPRVLAWIAAQKQTDQWRDVKFIPHLRTVLSGRRFDDPLPGQEQPASDGCVVCGAQASVTYEAQRYCRDHNPLRAAA